MVLIFDFLGWLALAFLATPGVFQHHQIFIYKNLNYSKLTMSAYYKRQVKKYLPPELLVIVNIYYHGPEEIFKKRKKLHKQINDPNHVILCVTDRYFGDPACIWRCTKATIIHQIEMQVSMHEREVINDRHYAHHKEQLAMLKVKVDQRKKKKTENVRLVHYSVLNICYKCSN